jgi:hypothetical protein
MHPLRNEFRSTHAPSTSAATITITLQLAVLWYFVQGLLTLYSALNSLRAKQFKAVKLSTSLPGGMRERLKRAVLKTSAGF